MKTAEIKGNTMIKDTDLPKGFVTALEKNGIKLVHTLMTRKSLINLHGIGPKAIIAINILRESVVKENEKVLRTSERKMEKRREEALKTAAKEVVKLEAKSLPKTKNKTTAEMVKVAFQNMLTKTKNYNAKLNLTSSNQATILNWVDKELIKPKTYTKLLKDKGLMVKLSNAIERFSITDHKGDGKGLVQQQVIGSISDILVKTRHIPKVRNQPKAGLTLTDRAKMFMIIAGELIEELVFSNDHLKRVLRPIEGSITNEMSVYYRFPMKIEQEHSKDILKNYHFISDIKAMNKKRDVTKQIEFIVNTDTHKVNEKMGAIANKIASSRMRALNYMSNIRAARRLNIGKEELFRIIYLSKQFGEVLEKNPMNATLNTQRLEKIVDDLHEQLSRKDGFVTNFKLDLTGRIYSQDKELTAIAMQGLGKMLYETTNAQVINQLGFRELMIAVGQYLEGKVDEETAIKAYQVLTYTKSVQEIKQMLVDTMGKEPSTEVVLQEYKTTEEAIKEIYLRTGVDLSNETDEDVVSEMLDVLFHNVAKENKEAKLAARNNVAKWLTEVHYLKQMGNAISDYHTQTPSHFVLLKDFAAGGLIWWSMLLGSEKMAKIAHMYGDCATFNDPYIHIVEEIFNFLALEIPNKDALKALRGQIKSTLQAILHGGTFAAASGGLRALARQNSSLADLQDLTAQKLKNAFVHIFGEEVLLIEQFTDWTIGIYSQENPYLSWDVDGMHGGTLAKGAKVDFGIEFHTNNLAGGRSKVLFSQTMPYTDIKQVSKKALEYTVENWISKDSISEEDRENEIDSIRGASANLLHFVDPMAVEMISNLLKGDLIEVIHDNFGTHLNNMHKVALGAKLAARKVNRGVRQEDGSYISMFQHIATQIKDQANARLEIIANRHVIARVSAELGAKCKEEGTKFDKALFVKMCQEQKVKPTKVIEDFEGVDKITPLDQSKIGLYNHFLQV